MAEIPRSEANIVAERIRAATAQGENTAQLVGGLMRDQIASTVWNNHGLFADRPASSTVTGDQYFAIDANVLFIWNGTAWMPQGGFVGVQHLVASEDAVAGDLTLDLDTALAFKLLLDDDVNLFFAIGSNPDSLMRSVRIEITVDGGSITWPPGVYWPGSTEPELADGLIHLVTVWLFGGSLEYRAQATEGYAVPA